MSRRINTVNDPQRFGVGATTSVDERPLMFSDKEELNSIGYSVVLQLLLLADLCLPQDVLELSRARCNGLREDAKFIAEKSKPFQTVEYHQV